MKSMKGFIFTLDAVFALIVASVGVSILLYMHFTSPNLSQPQTTEAFSILQNLLNTKIGQLTGSQYAVYASKTGSSNFAWPAFGGNSSLSSGKPYGPQALDLLYNFTASSNIVPIIAAGSGVVAFGAGSELYALNATTGSLVSGFPVSIGGTFLGSPVIYKGTIIYANSSGYLTAVSASTGARLWSSNIAISVDTPIALDDNYLAFGSGYDLYLAYPENGSIAASAALPNEAQAPAYANGEFVATTSSSGTQNYLVSYALSGNVLTRNWMVALSTSPVTTPSIYDSFIFVGSGSNLEGYTLGGVQKYNVALDSQIFGGIAGSSGDVFAETSDKLYSFNLSTATASYASLQPDSENATPSASSEYVYVMPSGSEFDAYSLSSGARIWNFTFPSSAYNKYASITLAYGNAYVAAGSNLYAFGTCRAPSNQSVAGALAEFYLNNEGGCAGEILRSISPSQNTGIFINGSFAPSLQTATFNGTWSSGPYNSNSFIRTSLPIGGKNYNFTITMWIRPSSVQNLSHSWTTAVFSFSGYQGFGIQNSCLPGTCLVLHRCSPADTSSGTLLPYSIFNNNWYFIAVAVKYPDYYWQIDNISTKDVNTNNYTGNPPATIGTQFAQCDSNAFNGSIANVQVYNKTLSPSQISQIYQQGLYGLPLNIKGLLAWYPLDGNANDYSGNNEAGIPHGISYENSGYLPGSLAGAYQVSKGSVPLSISVNGVSKPYNISAVVWR
ncbi:MAG: PQQ-binding-like beta-propeller repeat protein [Candidatus Micrarchaeia archaeon]